MERYPLLFLSCIFAGFALIKVPLTGFLQPLSPLAFLIGVLSVLVFSCILIFNGIMVLVGRKR
ncbi:hypothetical protein [Bacillus sp. Marseille-P3661]|uniref:hypothetical protein n=1 Tax=Bacillus sp. Marseille-P3661 TaxID=1936234 RepID=UPI000C85F47F|nr:hypothetical protein [Bacillus sp. Marseille-P3661]